ncbi:MAG: hypothetical protein NW237_10570, partial [Cyanobacteriota bacterium]|nr:hypothetical protein [Cyanobacteriota bacterium]
PWPTGRSTPVVGRKRTVSGENQPCNACPILPDWWPLASPLRRHAVAHHNVEGDSQPPRFHPLTQPKGYGARLSPKKLKFRRNPGQI